MSIALVEHNKGYVLIKDGTMLSYVNTEDPTDLGGVLFPYMRVIADEVDQLPAGTSGSDSPPRLLVGEQLPPRRPLRVVHIGGGAMTLARYIEHTRPFSSQVVVEPDRDMIDMVEEHLPWPTDRIFVAPVSGEAYLRITDPDSEDLVIMDAFNGYDIPKGLTTVECFDAVKRILKPGGTFITNVINDWQLFTDQVARTFDEVHAYAEEDILTGGTRGNVIVVAR